MSQRRDITRTFGDDEGDAGNSTLTDLASRGYGFPVAPPKGDVIRKSPDGSLKVGKFTLSSTGMQIDGVISQDEWRDAGKFIGRVGGAWQFWVGDWLNACNSEWGERYLLASEITGMKPDTLSNIASVCAKVQLPFRNGNLTFTHHVAVASLPPERQEYWLSKADQESLSVSKMRKMMKPKPVKSDPVPLLNKKNKVVFNRLWKGVLSQNAENVSLKDIEHIRNWLSEVEAALRG